MNTVTERNIGAMLGVAVGVLPQAASSGTINGPAIDRIGRGMAMSCVMHTMAGAATGTPTAISVQSMLQDSADGTTFANYLPDSVNAAQAAAITAASTDGILAVDLSHARRFVRVQTVVGFTGGTSPAIQVAADVIFGGEVMQPAV